MPQAIARKEIAAAIATRQVSLRALSQRVGLKSHAALSRFLNNRQQLSFELIVKLVRELGIEGRALERCIAPFIPEDMLPRTASRDIAAAVSEPQTPASRIAEVKFFFHPKMPLVYETLKIIGPANDRTLQASFHPRLGLRREAVADCLAGLERLGLVTRHGHAWQVVDANRDIVIPTRQSTEVGKRMIRDVVQGMEAFIDEGPEVRLMRSVVTSVKTPPADSCLKPLVPMIMRFHDDVLALQSSEDDAVINLLISAVRVSSRPTHRYGD